MDNEHKKSILDPHLRTPNINWELLSEAYKYYSNFYQYIETPYLIPKEYTEYTKPHTNNSFILTNDDFHTQPHELVGSAEQGFIYLLLNERLEKQKYFSITPCFRSEQFDTLHQPWFMKLELFNYSSDENDLESMIQECMSFFADQNIIPQLEQTSSKSYDILINNIEVGSYGFRKIENHTFIYGTGLALPRFTIALRGRNE